MIDLKRATFFLSASFPSGERGKSFEPYDPSAIADAVSAFTRAILEANGRLSFGGHPTITPLVFMIARELGVRKSVFVYQSEWFRDQLVPEIAEIGKENLGTIVWTPVAETLAESLLIMRHDMLTASRGYVAALFIGGMEGIRDEYDLVQETLPWLDCIPVTGPGGAAARLPVHDCVELGFAPLHESRAYPFVAVRFVEILADRGAEAR